MKRLFVMLGVIAFLAALPLSHLAMGQPPCPNGNDKVLICHVNSANDVIQLNGTLRVFGRVIEVSENAVAAHVEEHGDAVFPNYQTLTEEQREEWEEQFNVSLPNANCYFCVSLDVNG